MPLSSFDFLTYYIFQYLRFVFPEFARSHNISFRLSTMPASKAKSASANGSASGKTTKETPASTVPPSPVSKPSETDRALTNVSGKPDKSAYDAEQERLRSDIDALQAKLVCCIPLVIGAVPIVFFAGRRPRENNVGFQAFGRRQTKRASCGT